MSKFSLQNILNPFKEIDLETFDVLEHRKLLSEYVSKHRFLKRKYQVVILAAGKGSRMSIDYPKALYKLKYPYGKSTILKNTIKIIDSLKKSVFINKTFIVINELHKESYKNESFDESLNIITLNDNEIRGTAVCINAIKKNLDTDKDIIFLWGDLALWRAADLDLTIKIHELCDSSISFPTRLSNSPYVAFVRSLEGKFDKVVHSNESKRWDGFAEQDCLSFVCAYTALSKLTNFIDKFNQENSKHKFEIDFIHYIPFLASKGKNVIGVPIVELELLFGLNTIERANEINHVLSRFTKKEYNNYFGLN